MADHLRAYFAASDTDQNGYIQSAELQRCLSNGTWKPFNLHTVQLLLNMFDKTGRQAVTFSEFQNLWEYVTTWQRAFTSYDREQKGTLTAEQVHMSLTNSGYPLSIDIVRQLVRRFCASHGALGALGTVGAVVGDCGADFDDYIHICVLVQKMTHAFQLKDPEKTGVVHLQYNEFVSLLFEHIL